MAGSLSNRPKRCAPTLPASDTHGIEPLSATEPSTTCTSLVTVAY
jgi:hypothetical protein